MSALTIRLTRLSATHHRFEALRPDGSRWARELETKSLLRHDLTHFALESEAGLKHSFYGLLARGGDYDAVGQPLEGEALETERVVGPLQTAAKGDVDASAFVARLVDYHHSIGEAPPAWLSADVIRRAAARLKQLEGQWSATPFGETMTLEFPL